MENPNNRIMAAGCLEGDLVLSHEVLLEPFYTGILAVKRLSGAIDRLPITIPGKLMDYLPRAKEKPIRIDGQIRTYNKEIDGAGRLVVTVFAQGICEGQSTETTNSATLTGTLCKPPVYRTTPFGREICDFMVAVHRPLGRTDYIPCITWGRNAKYMSRFTTGNRVWLTGRLQSREYQKLTENGEYVTRNAYEVSAFQAPAGLYADRDAAYYADQDVLMPTT